MKTLPLIFVLLLVLGCGDYGHPFGRDMTFSPEADIEADTIAMVKRWNKATGSALKVGSGGVPVRYVDQARDADGKAVCGATPTAIERSSREVVGIMSVDITRVHRPGCDSPANTLVHEGAHAFAPYAEHSKRGVFRAVASKGDVDINESTLTAVCTDFYCTAFVPEDS